MQLKIMTWQIKNHKCVYMVFVVLYLVFVPVVGLLFGKGNKSLEYELVYGYVVFIINVLVCVLATVPFLVLLSETIHAKSRECIMLCSEWKETKQFLLSYTCSVIVISVMMVELYLIFRPYISVQRMMDNWLQAVVAIWLMSAVSHLVARGLQNLFFSFILIEMYGISCRILNIGYDTIWNVFSLDVTHGMVKLIRTLFYIVVGILLEIIVWQVNKKRIQKFDT